MSGGKGAVGANAGGSVSIEGDSSVGGQGGSVMMVSGASDAGSSGSVVMLSSKSESPELCWLLVFLTKKNLIHCCCVLAIHCESSGSLVDLSVKVAVDNHLM